MKSVKSILLGTAAFVATSGAAIAADMGETAPRAAGVAAAAFEPPPPAPTCKDKKGYFIVPNTTTCLKILGLIRAQTLVHENNAASDSWDPSDFGSVGRTPTNNDTWSMGTTARFGADVVQETDYGTLRGNITLQSDGDTNGDLGTSLRYAFVTWGGLTAGHTDSFFHPDGALGGYGTAIGDYGGNRRSLLGYTAKFTDEVSASLAIEDHDKADGKDGKAGSENADIYRTPSIPPVAPATDPTKTYALNDSTQLPDLVGNVVGKFDWGLLFASGAVGNYNVVVPVGGYKDSYVGWAVGAGGNVKLDMLAKGDGVQAKVGYADGAAGYIGSSADHAIIDTIGPNYDTLITTGWTAQGSFLHNWSPTWSSTAYGGYASADRTTNADTATVINDTVASAWNLGANLQWSPVENYTIGGELFYTSVDKDNLTTGNYTADAFGSIFRVERGF